MNTPHLITALLPLINVMFISSITPGPNNMMVMAASLHAGFRACLPHVWGIGAGFCFQVLMMIIGVGALFQALPILRPILAWTCAIYLIWLGYGLTMAAIKAGAKSYKNPQDSMAGIPITQPLSFWQACAFQWVNPKAWAMALSVPSGLIPTFPEAIGQSVGIGLCLLLIFLINFPCVLVWAGMGASLRHYLHIVWVARIFYSTTAISIFWAAWMMVAM